MKYCNKCKTNKELNEFYISKHTKSGFTGECKECIKERTRLYLLKVRPPKVKLTIEERKENARSYRRKYKAMKKATDPLYKLRENLRRRTLKAFETTKWNINNTTKDLLGCEYIEFKNHIESLFNNGMSWQNQGLWHVDHIIPLASATTEEEIKKLFHYTNLQPLWAEDNIRKSAKQIKAIT